jgi:RNA polymerase sigma-70 factor (ECF subfamily)
MLAAHNSAGRFRRQATVSTWLHRIVVNKCVDQLRRPDNRLTPVAEIDGTGTRDIDSDVLTAVLVHRALTALVPDQRAAVVAVDMHGYSVAEAAELLGVAQGTVKSRRARARARLAVLLADFDPVRPDAA